MRASRSELLLLHNVCGAGCRRHPAPFVFVSAGGIETGENGGEENDVRNTRKRTHPRNHVHIRPDLHVVRLASREVREHPDDTLGSLFDRFVSSPSAGTEMTAYALQETDPDEAAECFLNQELFMCCLELGDERRLDSLVG
jgi:hypothetical protein